ncbi:MAG: hypothetical protein WC728_14690 [Elusimicrobiota bacterium]
MESRPELNKLLHDVQSKCANIKSACQILNDCPEEEALDMLGDMTQAARDILRCLLELKKKIADGKEGR